MKVLELLNQIESNLIKSSSESTLKLDNLDPGYIDEVETKTRKGVFVGKNAKKAKGAP